jgi:hypothetical protein
MPESSDNRQFALSEAIRYIANIGYHIPGFSQENPAGVLQIAESFYQWLTVPIQLSLEIASLTYAQGKHSGPGTPTDYYEGNTHMATLSDTQQVLLSVAETDSKGAPVTADTLTWTVDDPTVIALTVSADTSYSATAVAGVPGSAVVTVADNSTTPPLTGTVALTVVAGAATSLVVSEGTPEPQP